MNLPQQGLCSCHCMCGSSGPGACIRGASGCQGRGLDWEKRETYYTFPSSSLPCSAPSSHLSPRGYLPTAQPHTQNSPARGSLGMPLPEDTVGGPTRGRGKICGAEREATVGGDRRRDWVMPCSETLRSYSALPRFGGGTGPDAPRKPRDGFSWAGGEQHLAPGRWGPAPSSRARRRAENRPRCSCGRKAASEAGVVARFCSALCRAGAGGRRRGRARYGAVGRGCGWVRALSCVWGDRSGPRAERCPQGRWQLLGAAARGSRGRAIWLLAAVQGGEGQSLPFLARVGHPAVPGGSLCPHAGEGPRLQPPALAGGGPGRPPGVAGRCW
ncbi:uncharacterized protein LOC121084912 [Falco naumanni]|uniref:uncharacterized protein LOC121084912 n=1 Tax=Falco naumanni TaxID=148594 RepID=UPI001ADDECD7|nr:uncharacterized protein LOC121084912 [Falco naumanni]